MGLKVSTTCELTLRRDTARRRWAGCSATCTTASAQMFLIIEYARMMVGTKAIATLSTGYLNALDYAKNRVQGADLTQMADKTAPRVTITHHPDVRRMLMLQKAYAEGLRALVLYTATWQDAVMAEAAGDEAAERRAGQRPAAAAGQGRRLGAGVRAARPESLQTFGGSGFLQDYPIEQYVRDAKIDTLYEGTTAIQGLDLFFRKIVRDNGEALTALAGEIRHVRRPARPATGGSRRSGRRSRQALADVQAMVGAMVGWLMAAAGGRPAASTRSA